MSVNSKMAAIADEVRTLSGTTDKLSLDDMASRTNEANAEVGAQEDLIQQIKIALQGKVAAGGTTENLDEVLAEQEALIAQLRSILDTKAGGGGDLPAMEMVATFADGTTQTYVIYGEIAE